MNKEEFTETLDDIALSTINSFVANYQAEKTLIGQLQTDEYVSRFLKLFYFDSIEKQIEFMEMYNQSKCQR